MWSHLKEQLLPILPPEGVCLLRAGLTRSDSVLNPDVTKQVPWLLLRFCINHYNICCCCRISYLWKTISFFCRCLYFFQKYVMLQTASFFLVVTFDLFYPQFCSEINCWARLCEGVTCWPSVLITHHEVNPNFPLFSLNVRKIHWIFNLKYEAHLGRFSFCKNCFPQTFYFMFP